METKELSPNEMQNVTGGLTYDNDGRVPSLWEKIQVDQEKKIQCPFCRIIFPDYRALAVHIRQQHS